MLLYCGIFIISIAFVPVDSALSWKIINGVEAKEGDLPYQVSLKVRGSHVCGGSILNANWIVTAASCVQDVDVTNLSIVVGSIKVNTGGVTHKVADVIYHESYDPYLIDYDIAVIKLVKPIEFSDNVQPISLADEPIVGGEECIVSGWGSSTNKIFSDDLLYMFSKAINFKECADLHIPSEITNSQICTVAEAIQGSCYGDVGGPLVNRNGGTLIGIISWFRPCATGAPDVYTSIYYFRGWIYQHILNM